MRPSNPSAAPSRATALSKPFTATSCRGEDSNLCSVAEPFFLEGRPLRRSGSGLAPGYALLLLAAVATATHPLVVVYVAVVWADVMAARWAAAQWRPLSLEVVA